MAVLSVNMSEGTAVHFGTNQGEWFLSEQKNLKENFLKYCQSMTKSEYAKLVLNCIQCLLTEYSENLF